MLKKGICLLWAVALFLCCQPALGLEFNRYNWEENRQRTVLTEAENALPEIVVRNHHLLQFVYEDDQLLVYNTLHRIVKVGNEEAIQRNNKIYIPLYNVLDLIDIKARSISRTGEIRVLDQQDIKELKDEKLGNSYKIFAIEGVEAGGEVEYFYTRKMQASFFDRLFFQHETPVKKASIELTSPVNLKFDFKSYNGFPEVLDMGAEGMNRYLAAAENIPTLKREEYASFEATRMRLEYKLAYNTHRGGARLFTWDDAAKRIYGNVCLLEKAEQKSVEKFCRQVRLEPSAALEDKIRAIENHIKSNIYVEEENFGEELRDISSIVEKKLASKVGVTRLFAAAFRYFGIGHQLVVTCDRTHIPFDGSFDSWSSLDDYLVYFPETGKFLAPARPDHRYWLIPFQYTANQALFIDTISTGTSGLFKGSIKTIPAFSSQTSFDNLDIEVDFEKDISGNNIKVARSFGGHSAAYIQPYYPILAQDNREKMVEELIKQVVPDAQLGSWVVKNGEANLSPVMHPFRVEATVKSSQFIEKAGNKYLFKAGELLGPQVELYKDENRVNPAENDYNRTFDRNIVIRLPEGFRIKNPDDLNMDVFSTDAKGERVYSFSAGYVLTGNVVKIRIEEFYKEIYCPLEQFQDFRKVVNAAADYNKINLVLEKVN